MAVVMGKKGGWERCGLGSWEWRFGGFLERESGGLGGWERRGGVWGFVGVGWWGRGRWSGGWVRGGCGGVGGLDGGVELKGCKWEDVKEDRCCC